MEGGSDALNAVLTSFGDATKKLVDETKKLFDEEAASKKRVIDMQKEEISSLKRQVQQISDMQVELRRVREENQTLRKVQEENVYPFPWVASSVVHFLRPSCPLRVHQG